MLDRFTQIGALCQVVRRVVTRRLMFLVIPLLVATALLYLQKNPGTNAFALIALSSCAALWAWCGSARGLPLLPVMVVQGLLIYGIPIVASNESLSYYTESSITAAGVEVMIFNLVLVAAWSAGMRIFTPSRPVSHALELVRSEGFKALTRIGFGLASASTVFVALDALGKTEPLYQVLPAGISSIFASLASVAGASGFFLVSTAISGSACTAFTKICFWVLLIVNACASASSFLLSSAAISLITVAIGLFWGSGRLPWRYLTLVILLLSFFNLGKATMRGRYWGAESEPSRVVQLSEVPDLYWEWVQTSYDAMLQNHNAPPAGIGTGSSKKNQTLLERIDNMQNLLFVMDAVEREHIEPLHGATYTLIPPLLIPRVLWPDKPRSHEGQVLLNVHFGRQDISSTFETYIAWGLLPEAFGNFGPIMGSVFLGVFFGFAFAWVENLTARKLLVSTEGFLALTLMISLMNSFEMVASVFITSTFQAFIVVVASSAPFVRKVVTTGSSDAAP